MAIFSSFQVVRNEKGAPEVGSSKTWLPPRRMLSHGTHAYEASFPVEACIVNLSERYVMTVAWGQKGGRSFMLVFFSAIIAFALTTWFKYQN